MLRLRRSWAVARKETTDIIRDRRTVFMAVVFPVILYPLLIIGVVQATVVREARTAKRTLVVAVSGAENAPGTVGEIAKEEDLEVVDYVKGVGRFGHKDALVTVVFPPDFRDQLSQNLTARIALFHDGTDPASEKAMAKVIDVLDGVTVYIRDRRLEERNLSREFAQPIAVDRIDVATARQRGAFQITQILAFLLVVLCMMGALYPALDAVAGEKERGTLETLLSIPATRLEILAGKYAAVFAMSVTSVVSNLISLSATLFMVNYLLKLQPQQGAPVDFSVSLSASLIFIPALLPLAAFFSAVTLGVASFARSTREGQYYLGPLYALVLPLTALALSPTVRLTWFTAFVPVLSMALFLKAGLLG
ncbi:MAG: ABC transporter permease subunit, partial [Planctomycetota bacterium]